MNKEHLIAKYFSESLSPEAQKEFDHLMVTDSEFEKTVKFQTDLKTVITKEEQTQLKQELQSLENSTKKPIKNYTKWLVAASIAVFIAISNFWYFGQSDLSNENLFVTNFEPYKNVVHPIVRGKNSNDLITKAFISYEATNYKEALNAFDALLNESDNASISFYKANVLLQLNKNKEAISILSNNSDIPEILKAQQQWYLALAYIKANANNKAKATLKILIENANYKKKESEELLEQLTP